jgi:hypothetical protein
LLIETHAQGSPAAAEVSQAPWQPRRWRKRGSAPVWHHLETLDGQQAGLPKAAAGYRSPGHSRRFENLPASSIVSVRGVESLATAAKSAVSRRPEAVNRFKTNVLRCQPSLRRPSAFNRSSPSLRSSLNLGITPRERLEISKRLFI